MDFTKKFIILIAVFCVICSVAAISAADVNDQVGNYQDIGGYAGSNYYDSNGVSGSQYYQSMEGQVGNQLNDNSNNTISPLIDPDQSHSEQAAGEPINGTNQNSTSNATSNATGHANVTSNNTQNTTNTTSPSNLLATGNPILVLLGVSAIVGGVAALKRRK